MEVYMTHTYLVSLLTSLTLAGCSMKNPNEGSEVLNSTTSQSVPGELDGTVNENPESSTLSELNKEDEIDFEGVQLDMAVDVAEMEQQTGSASGVGGLSVAGVGSGGGGALGISASPSPRGVYSARKKGRSNERIRARPMIGSRPLLPSVPEEYVANTEGYTDHGVNAFTAVKDDAKSTFSIDVDTASYTMSRRKLQQGSLPAWEAVRVEEFVNYFDYSYDDPRVGPFAVHMEAMPDPFRQNSHILRVGVQAKRYKPNERPPLHLTFLADVSGSMSSADKLGLAKESMHTMVDNLQEGDTVALATYAGRVARILEPTDASNASRIHRAIASLNSGGSTAMSSGIEIAYDLAIEAFEKGAENRVVILSDGDANVGSTSWEDMLEQIKGHANKGVTLSTIGFGQGNYQDTLMEQLANKGDGNNYYVDSQKESDRIFQDKLTGTMITVARDTKIQVEFNADAVESYRLIGYENRDIADKDFRNDRVDAGEVGSGHSVTALYEVVLSDGADVDELATVRIRWEKPGADGRATERSFTFESSALNDDVSDASESLKLAYGAATLAEVLRQSPHITEIDLVRLRELIQDSIPSEDARELARLVSKAERLGAGRSQRRWASASGR
jgi:Ca-activated chloride channel family protein